MVVEFSPWWIVFEILIQDQRKTVQFWEWRLSRCWVLKGSLLPFNTQHLETLFSETGHHVALGSFPTCWSLSSLSTSPTLQETVLLLLSPTWNKVRKPKELSITHSVCDAVLGSGDLSTDHNKPDLDHLY